LQPEKVIAIEKLVISMSQVTRNFNANFKTPAHEAEVNQLSITELLSSKKGGTFPAF